MDSLLSPQLTSAPNPSHQPSARKSNQSGRSKYSNNSKLTKSGLYQVLRSGSRVCSMNEERAAQVALLE
jgi:hypothetical protein